MRRRLIILGCVLAVLIVAWAVPIVALNAIENKHAVPARELVVDDPSTYPSLKPMKWTDQKIAPDVEGVYARSWASGKIRLLERVHRYGSSIGAFYAFSTQDPLFVYERGTRIVTAQPPSGLRADQAEFFCVDFASKHGSGHKCFAWSAWLRYGQYTVYVAIANMVLSEADFASIMQRVDADVDRALL
jgi:hypothetical protein